MNAGEIMEANTQQDSRYTLAICLHNICMTDGSWCQDSHFSWFAES